MVTNGLAQTLDPTTPGSFVLYDPPARGGDGTYFTGDARTDDSLWVPGLARARVMTAAQLRQALEDCDAAGWFRARFEYVRVLG